MSTKVLLAKAKGKSKKKSRTQPGTLSVTVRCDQASKVALAGTLTRLIGKQPKHGRRRSLKSRLGPVSRFVKRGASTLLTVKLPPAALAALGTNATESVSFNLTATNANGSGRATAKIATLKGSR
jgi:hypothetical protein